MHRHIVAIRRWRLAAAAVVVAAATPAACAGLLAAVAMAEDPPISASRQARPTVIIEDGELLLNGVPFPIRGVNWNPAPKGKAHPEGLDYAGFAPVDIPLMAAAGINAVRTYEPLDDVAVLDAMAAAGIFVFTTVYASGGVDPSVVTGQVAAVRDHLAIMAYVLGNEWDLNGLYVGLSRAATREKLNAAATLVHEADPDRSITSIWSDDVTGLAAVAPTMPRISLWGVNAYRGPQLWHRL